jgi:hypothetical protein
MKSAIRHEFFVAKTLDLALTSTYYFFFALAASMALNFLTQIYETYSSRFINNGAKKDKPLPQLMFEVVANIFFLLFVLWIIRNVVERIPFPLEGYGGYAHARLSLPTIIALSSVVMLFFQTSLMDKIRELNARVFAAAKLSDTWLGRTMKNI